MCDDAHDYDDEPNVEHTARMDDAIVADGAVDDWLSVVYPNAGRPCDHDYGSLQVQVGEALLPACGGCGVARIFLPPRD